ncbi:Beta protein [Bradyrhizobium sp. Ghvi]|nr:Beta protein [Bradyrhizobium sp. Ghvi]
MSFIYRPMLKTKTGEAAALLQLGAPQRDRIEPVFHVGERPPANFVARMAAAWSSRRCFLDGAFNFNVSGGPQAFSSMLRALVAAGVQVIPVIELGAATAYNQAARSHVGRGGPGAMLKCTASQLSGAAAFAQQLQLAPSDVDLLVDAGHVAEFDPTSFGGYLGSILQANALGTRWRSLTLASSSAPKDFGQLGPGLTVVPRIDWLTWRQLPQGNRPIDYADFGISHRDLTEPPGMAMAAATVSVRYTIDDNWIMIKGKRTTGASGVPMGDQYRTHARTLVRRPEFGGLPVCWADQRISTIAGTLGVSAGGRAQWVEINANRHFAFIVDRLP